MVTVTKDAVSIYYIVDKKSRAREAVHTYHNLSVEKIDEGNGFVEITCNNPHEDLQNWVNKENKLLNKKLTEAQLKEFYYQVTIVKSSLDYTPKTLRVVVPTQEQE